MNRGWTVLAFTAAALLAHRVRAAWTALHDDPPELDDDLDTLLALIREQQRKAGST